jgi:hypothetical protein
MKQKVNPVVMAVCIVVVLAVVIVVGMRTLNPPAPVAAKPKPVSDKPAEINGHAVPNGVPYEYYQRMQKQGGAAGQATHP